MIKILFICHGNICRSPMAEFVLRDMVTKQGLSDQFFISSAATSTEEIGNPVHPGTRKKLKEFNITTDGKYAVQLLRKDYDRYDYLIGMDNANIRNMERMLGHRGGRYTSFWSLPDRMQRWRTHGILEILTEPMKTLKKAVRLCLHRFWLQHKFFIDSMFMQRGERNEYKRN